MPVKIGKLLLCGQTGVGKTALVEQLLYGNHNFEAVNLHPTIEDIYTAVIETDRGVKEKMRIFDIGGLDVNNTELPKHYLNFPDGFVLVYDVTNMESFKKLDKLKKDIDKARDKKEIHIIVIGNKSEKTESREVDFTMATQWANKEKLRHWEVSVANRQSLVEPFVYLASKVTTPPSKSTFLPGRKAKSVSTES